MKRLIRVPSNSGFPHFAAELELGPKGVGHSETVPPRMLLILLVNFYSGPPAFSEPHSGRD